jgi:hypothetical protein
MEDNVGMKVSKQRQKTTPFAQDRPWSHSRNSNHRNVSHRPECAFEGCAWSAENSLQAPEVTIFVNWTAKII